MVPIHLPPSGWKRDGDMGQAFTGPCQQVGDVAPRFDAAAATGLEHAQSGGVGRRALLGAGAVGDPPGDDGVPQGTLGFVVGGGQIGVGDEGGDGGPIVEYLAGELVPKNWTDGLALALISKPRERIRRR